MPTAGDIPNPSGQPGADASASAWWQHKTVLITGGLGFIGSNLAIRLVDLGAEVTLIDSLIPDYGGNMFNINGLEKAVHVNLSDIRDRFSMEVLLQNKQVIFNLAGQTSHMDSMRDPQTDLAINGAAQLSLLEQCRAVNPTARIVFASTRQIYGRPQYLPVDEDHPVNPVDVNGINKLSAELYHRLYHNVYGLSTRILRLTNTIGPRMRIRDARQTFLGIWIRQLLEGVPIDVWGGEQLRDFNDVDDVVDALLIAGQIGELAPSPYNLGSSETITLLDLARMLIAIYGKGDVNIRSFPADRKKIDIGDYFSSFARYQQATGWQPRRSLAHTLERTLAYYAEHRNHYL
jgi:nucleoside-diphosphate-sugar epimerase